MDLLLSREGAAWLAAFALGTAASSWMVTRWATAFLRRRAVLARPNARSSHSEPTPTGGGAAVLAVALPLMALVLWLSGAADAAAWALLAGAAALAVISGVDDVRGLPVALRLAAHAAAVAGVLALIPDRFLVFQGALPPFLDRAAAALAWVWFVNLFNFMDGIDGIAGVETIAIGGGIFAIALVIGGRGGISAQVVGLEALILAAAAAGFLALNWHPARVFLGDVGSVPLGFLLGGLLIAVATWGYWQAAIILPAYYLADATLTIALRAARGAPVWRAHAEHFYQRAVRRGLGHGRVARFVAAGNALLVALALASIEVLTPAGDALCLGGAAAIVAFMLFWLARGGPASTTAS